MKQCLKCGELKDLDSFGKRNDTKDGRRSQCRVCRNNVNNKWQRSEKAKESKNAWAKENREKRREYEKRYWSKNPEKLKEKRARGGKVWRDRYPEKARIKDKKWRLANPEKRREIERRFREAHPNKSRDDAIRRRALELGVESVKYTEDEIFAKWGTDCHICGEPVDLEAPRQVGVSGWERGLHLDHVMSISRGGPDTPDNVKPSHGICNLRKN